MDSTFVVTGGRKNLKKHGKAFFMPEVHVENEEGVRKRSSSIIKHSTPYQSSPVDKEPLSTTVDSGFEDWSLASSTRYDSNNNSIRSEKSTYKTPKAKPVEESLWESFITPIADLRHHLRGRQTFVDHKVKIKFNVETLVTVCLGIVMFSSIVFSVYMGTSFIAPTNGKLRSIKYGTNKRLENLRKDGRIIDYDIKDEFGNVLGGKRAAIQYAYDKKYGKVQKPKEEPPKREQKPPKDSSENDIRPKVAKASVEDPVQIQKELSIAELSQKIDELNALLQDDLLGTRVETDIDTEIASLKANKKKLLQRVKARNSARPRQAAPAAPAAPKVQEAVEVEETAAPAQKVPKGKTKAQNPLTKDLPQKSKAKKVKKIVETNQENQIDDYPGAEDKPEIDPGMEDYPDDPQFRGKQDG
eukprot:TRINITY_DN110_c0_g1_i3.p1 TRINITY_DN110_c0_g1~~TRINITY_DN110_c0_g1_i3.p1  ORF type:complete len:414 (-),score=110.85 TRINITY_DN110_c0_g1_i3:132-1373(-)